MKRVSDSEGAMERLTGVYGIIHVYLYAKAHYAAGSGTAALRKFGYYLDEMGELQFDPPQSRKHGHEHGRKRTSRRRKTDRPVALAAETPPLQSLNHGSHLCVKFSFWLADA